MTTVDLGGFPTITVGDLDVEQALVVQLADVGIPGPPGNTADAEALVNALAARAAAIVQVTNPTQARPAAPFVLWLGGAVEPAQMGAQDLWAPAPAD